MFRKLLIVFVSAVVLSLAAFGGAWLVGGDKFTREFAKNDGWSFTFGEDGDNDKGPVKTREFAIESGSQIAMEIPVELRFTRGDAPRMTVEGPSRVVDRLLWDNGRLSIDGSLHSRKGLKVTITAPEIRGLDLEAPGDVKLVGLDQDQFSLTADGAVNLDARGKVRKLFVTANGAGNIDLGKVEGEDATVRVDGAGDVTVGSSRLADIEINGVGHVTLVRKPEILRSHINGIGTVDHDYKD
ncbi:DUF2807 domain-containing protein [Novosphingobium sp. 1949]|uniref:DUF2807 domain-containing protein n=1 Tax=Novosphingobium organovorum TaxID=2930092 RepID=A0ABT0BBH5_9SPHN|nr:DUF2807 domain-containing protein [Novosphingobium organovorum]MCJ2182235.1 DUF2807 domain-containing protein [Novosphingobium organovorum]